MKPDRYSFMCLALPTKIHKNYEVKIGDRISLGVITKIYDDGMLEIEVPTQLIHKSKALYIYTQEYLQSLLLMHIGKCELLSEFHRFAWNYDKNMCKKYSINELWLIYTIEYLFNKTWDNDKKMWVNK